MAAEGSLRRFRPRAVFWGGSGAACQPSLATGCILKSILLQSKYNTMPFITLLLEQIPWEV
jgi:hypothetical protein